MTEENPDLQRKIVKALNEEIGSDLKQLHKLKELYDETKAVQNDLKEKVKSFSFSCLSYISKLLNISLLSAVISQYRSPIKSSKYVARCWRALSKTSASWKTILGLEKWSPITLENCRHISREFQQSITGDWKTRTGILLPKMHKNCRRSKVLK